MSVELAKYFEESTLPDTGKSKLFGELVKLSAPIVKHYVSDLYRDAQFVMADLNEEGEFFYGADEWGTAIGTEEKFIRYSRSDNVWRLEITHRRGVWSVEIYALTLDGAPA